LLGNQRCLMLLRHEENHFINVCRISSTFFRRVFRDFAIPKHVERVACARVLRSTPNLHSRLLGMFDDRPAREIRHSSSVRTRRPCPTSPDHRDLRQVWSSKFKRFRLPPNLVGTCATMPDARMPSGARRRRSNAKIRQKPESDVAATEKLRRRDVETTELLSP